MGEDESSAEKAVQELEVMMKSVLENSTDYILTANKDQGVMYFNRPLPGMNVEQSLSLTVTDYFPPDYHGTVRDMINKVLKTGKTTDFELTTVGEDAQPNQFKAKVSPVQSQGETLAAIIVIQDVTKLNRLEEENAGLKRGKLPEDASGGDEALKGQVQTLQATVKKLQSESGQLETLKKENTQLKQQLDQLTELNKTLSKTPQASEDFQKDMKNLQQENKKLKQQVSEVVSLKQQVIKLTKENSELKIASRDGVNMQRKLAELQAENKKVEAYKKKNAQLIQQMQHLLEDNKKLHDFQKENTIMRKQVEQLNLENTRLKELWKENNELRQLNQTLMEENKQLTELQNENMELRNQIDTYNSKILEITRIKDQEEGQLKADLRVLEQLDNLVQDRIKQVHEQLKSDESSPSG